MLAVTWMLTINILKSVKKKERTKRMANSEEKEKMAEFEVVVTSRTLSQAVFIESVVMSEIAAVLAKYEKDIIELGEEQ